MSRIITVLNHRHEPQKVPTLAHRRVWAITPAIDGRGGYDSGFAVTHIPTGRLMVRLSSWGWAKDVFERLVTEAPRFGEALRKGELPRRTTATLRHVRKIVREARGEA